MVSNTLPDGWVEHVDPSSGKTYYYNAEKNTTSWELPSPSKSSENEGNHAEGSGQDSLPDGWQELKDPGSGKTYYYNAEKNATTWEKPSSTGEPVATDDESSSSSNSSLEEGWVELSDPASGKKYYFNADKNVTSWEKPKANKSTKVQQPQEEKEEEEDEEEEEENDGMPPGWREHVDKETGVRYYFNKTTGDKSWDKPLIMKKKKNNFGHLRQMASNNFSTSRNNRNNDNTYTYSNSSSSPAQTEATYKNDGKTGCYLVYESHSGGRLILQYSKGIVPDNPVGMIIPGDGQIIPGFKFTQNHGRTELIKGIAGGDSNRRKYFVGWCQFLKLAKQMNGLVIKYPCLKQGVEVDVYGYQNSDGTAHFLDLEEGYTNLSNYNSLAVMPKHHDFLMGVKKILPANFLEKGNVAGSTTLL